MTQVIFEVYNHNASPLISKDDELKRLPPRPKHLQDSAYLDKFDSDTIFYDAYRSDNNVILTGPPLRNLRGDVEDSLSKAVPPECTIEIMELDRVCHICITNADSIGNSLNLQLGNNVYNVDISESFTNEYEDKIVLFTKSKNNDLNWIRDWAQYYVRIHGVNAVLLYDNGSTDYSVLEISEALQIEGLDVATVVEWPFKFGPQGGKWNGPEERPWDSDYCQYGIFEHARQKYLKESYALISHDIDELMVIEDNASLIDHLRKSDSDYISYTGVWIEVPLRRVSSSPSFSDYGFINSHGSPTSAKWSALSQNIRDAEQWKTHGVAGKSAEKLPMIRHRHFRGITTNWKWDRTRNADRLSTDFALDRKMISLMEGAFSAPEGVEAHALDPKDDSARLRNYLEGLALEINFLNWESSGFTRSWFWKQNIYVAEFESETVGPFAFEIRIANSRISLVLVSRRTQAAEAMAARLNAQYLKFGKSGRHYEIAWWRLHIDRCDIARMASLAIERAVGILT